MPFGFTVDTLHVALEAIAFVTVRDQAHVASQPEFATLAAFSVVGSPPFAGFAAR
jgi:hypothetical protein